MHIKTKNGWAELVSENDIIPPRHTPSLLEQMGADMRIANKSVPVRMNADQFCDTIKWYLNGTIKLQKNEQLFHTRSIAEYERWVLRAHGYGDNSVVVIRGGDYGVINH